MGSHGSWKATAAALALALVLPAAAAAGVRSAESVLPPGQSGFVPPDDSTQNPHLTDQVALFESFAFKPAGFDQPGAVETPRAGVTITRDAYGVPNVRAGSADDAWFGVGYAVAQDRLVELELFRRSTRGPARRGARRGPAAVRHRGAARLLHARPSCAPQLRQAARGAARALRRLRRGRQRLDRARRGRPVAAPARVRAARPDAGAVDGARLRRDRRPARPHRAVRRRPRARELARAARARRQALRPLLPLRRPGTPATVPASRRALPVPARPQPRRRAPRLQGRRSVPEGPQAAEGAAPRRRSVAGRLPARGGSFHFALRGPGNTASLFSAPQLGFSIPELFVEYEVHAPGLDVRGVTGPGIPVIAAGHNGRIAWGITSGLGDDDDLYVERLAGKERYRFKGRTRKMRCRNETFKVSGAKSVKRRFCRTVHGPVQATAGAAAPTRAATRSGAASCRRSSASPRSTTPSSVAQADAAAAKLTWNENLLVADDGGHIGWWHPGLLPLRPKRWDERLPLPGTGEAEWRGLLAVKARPKVIDPPQGYLGNWNNLPSAGWTNGDAPAQETNEGDLHRGAFLQRALRRDDRPHARRPEGDRAPDRHDRAAAPAARRPAARRAGGGDRPGADRARHDRRLGRQLRPHGRRRHGRSGRGRVRGAQGGGRTLRRRPRGSAGGGSHPLASAPRLRLHSLSTAGSAARARRRRSRAASAPPIGRVARARKLYDVRSGRRERAAAGVLRPRDVLAGVELGPWRDAGTRPRAGRSTTVGGGGRSGSRAARRAVP